ncbi:MAG: hypothetical protein QOI78_8349, partial [Actinomycetota bacterium]|nr:hypothetical protein [Actinomycetota bacterium]
MRRVVTAALIIPLVTVTLTSPSPAVADTQSR